MNFKRWMFVFALLFSFVFSFVYVCMFVYSKPQITNTQSIYIYMNQIGLYKEYANAQTIKDTLSTKDILAYIYKKDDVYAVVCGVSKNSEETDQNGKILSDLSYPYLRKELKINNAEAISYVEAKDYEKVLEMIQNQSQGNAN